MKTIFEHKHFAARASYAAFLSILLALSSLLAPEAFADVRKTDIVGGQPIEARGLNILNSPSVDANYVYVADSDGNVYFERDSSSETNIASITKVMTAVVALEHGTLSQKVEVSQAAATVGESTAYLLAGDVLSLEDALKGLMLPSGNDAAIAIAESVGKNIANEARDAGDELHKPDGSVIDLDGPSASLDAFVAKMNEKATELGCENTLFANPHGLDIGQFAADMHSSAKDVALICAEAMSSQTFRDIVKTDQATLSVSRSGNLVDVKVESTDEMLNNYEGACGIKTGFTNAAGACFAGASERDGLTLFAIVLDSSSEAQRFTDARTLFDWVYSSKIDYKLANSDKTTQSTAFGNAEVPVVAEAALSDWNGKTLPVTLADPDATVAISSIYGNISQDIQIEDVAGSVSAGDVVGKADFYQQNEIVASVDLVACDDVEAPSVLDSLGVAWERFIGMVTGGDPRAQTVIYNQTPMVLEKSQQEPYN